MYNKKNALHIVHTTKKNRLIIMALLTVTFIMLSIMLFSGCKKKDSTTSGSGKTTYNLRMTDAPGDYDAVFVDIIGAEVHSDIDGWVALNVIPGIYNLMDLTNGKDTLIASGQIAVGNVSQIRLILGDNNTVVINNTVFPLTTPSAQQSGLKLNVQAELMNGIAYTMLIDFDADKSIVETGSGKYILKPVIRVVTKALNGAIQGTALPLISQPAIYAIIGTDSFSTYANPLNGSYYIGGLQAGTYKVVFMPKTPFADTAVSGVNISAGLVTNLGIMTVK